MVYSYGDPGHILIEGVVGLLKGWLRANHQQPLAIYSPGTVGGDSWSQIYEKRVDNHPSHREGKNDQNKDWGHLEDHPT